MTTKRPKKKRTKAGTSKRQISTEMVPIASLVSDPRNARRHDERNIRSVRDSLARHGQLKPIVVRRETKVVVAGNATLLAAKQLGWTVIAANIVNMSDEEATAFGIADNRTAELAHWDRAVLAELLEELGQETAQEVGFTTAEIDDILRAALDSVPEPVPPSPRDADDGFDPEKAKGARRVKSGEVWKLGEHFLICSDCREARTYKLVPWGEIEKVRVAVTSPPYAAQRDYDPDTEFKPVPPDAYVEWFAPIAENIRSVLTRDGSFFLNIKPHCDRGQRVLYVNDLVAAHVRQWGWRLIDELAWVHGGTPAKVVVRFRNGWEPIFHFARCKQPRIRPENVAHEPKGGFGDSTGRRTWSDRPGKGGASYPNKDNQGEMSAATHVQEKLAYPTNVLSVGRNKEVLGHAAAFPVGLPEFFVRAYSDQGDTVLDPFMGSGSTLIACEQAKRRCIGIEISPRYCDIILQRWEKLTKKKAVLHG